MPSIDLSVLQKNLHEQSQEETVPFDYVNRYLLDKVIFPVRNGECVRYGDIDFDQFDDLDLRYASGYCRELHGMSYRLDGFIRTIRQTEACAIKHRAFC